jgi:hypothetical protein
MNSVIIVQTAWATFKCSCGETDKHNSLKAHHFNAGVRISPLAPTAPDFGSRQNHGERSISISLNSEAHQ